ncbi:MAG: iron-containing alcohol dehydrogenase [Pirellulaceae bacterium]
MISFDYHSSTRLVFGAGKIDTLSELVAELGGSRILLISDPGIIQAGHTDRAVTALRQASLEVEVFGNVQENPTTADVAAGCQLAEQFRPDLLVGLGGGSSMDCAKGINFIYTNGGEMKDYWGTGKASKPMLPMIAIPTTAGTGSETQSFALISDAETHVKMACGDRKARCAIALLDPTLTLTQPPRVTALTGIDALSHALETFVTTKRSLISLTFSRESWRLLSHYLPRVLDDPDNLETREGMQIGACLAGLAIENSMLGATHALANPLTSEFDLIHGQAIGILLPHVIRYNGVEVGAWYQELTATPEVSAEKSCEQLAQFVQGLVAQAGLPTSLSQCDISRENLSKLADQAAEQWTAQFNPRKVGSEELASIYEQAF